MFDAIPTYFWAFFFAAVAFATGKLLTGRVRDDPGSFPGWILYAVGIGCVVIGLAVMWLDTHV